MSSRLAATEHCQCGATRTVTETTDETGLYETRGLWTMALCRTHPGGFHHVERREPVPQRAPA